MGFLTKLLFEVENLTTNIENEVLTQSKYHRGLHKITKISWLFGLLPLTKHLSKRTAVV